MSYGLCRGTKLALVFSTFAQDTTADTGSATFRVKVNVIDGSNSPLPSTLIAGYTIKWTAGGKNWKVSPQPSLTLSNASSAQSKKYTVPFPAAEKNVTVKVKLVSLTDSTGKNVMSEYMLVGDSAPYSALGNYQKDLTMPDGLTNGLVQFTLKKVQDVAKLNLTKAVTYKGVPMRVNGTYYMGIFTDPEHTKLLYKKALSLRNASSLTSTLKINLYKLKNESHSITLYFAETDRNGKVVSSGKKTGYNISLNKTSVTLSPTNANESVVLTNDILKGSRAEQRLTDPGSGFAGDSGALSQAQQLENEENTASKPTGDETPFAPYAAAAAAALAAILLAAYALIRRRRRA